MSAIINIFRGIATESQGENQKIPEIYWKRDSKGRMIDVNTGSIAYFSEEREDEE